MIGTIAGWLLTRNPAMTLIHARRIAKIGLAVAGAIALVGGFALWLHFHDKAVEDRVNLERNVEDQNANTEANETAGLAKGERDAGEIREQEGLEDEVDEADDAGRSAADDLWNDGLFDPE